jgi:hypothetical protein
VPAAALGARTLLVLPEQVVDVALGVFFLAMVPGRRWLATRNIKLGFGGLALAGAVIGFLTGIVVSTGPLSVPAFAAYGLVKGAFIATEAAGSLALYISKAVTFQQFGALPIDIVLKGLITGSSVMAGTYTARLIVERLSVATFQRLLDGVMVISGLTLLWAAIR